MLNSRITKLIIAKTNRTLFVTNSIMKRNASASEEADCTDIVWMDLEMTGLDVSIDKVIKWRLANTEGKLRPIVIEVSCLITDKNLNIISTGPSLAINFPKKVFETMGDWCRKQHYGSGLVQKCLDSKITESEAELIILEFLQRNIPKRKCPLAGNSVYMDRLFLRKCMPTVDAFLHYRIIDVSTIKELCRRWNSEVVNSAPVKTFSHRSLKDIEESIDELQYYREHFFKSHEM